MKKEMPRNLFPHMHKVPIRSRPWSTEDPPLSPGTSTLNSNSSSRSLLCIAAMLLRSLCMQGGRRTPTVAVDRWALQQACIQQQRAAHSSSTQV